MRIPEEVIREIRDRIDLVAVIGERVQLRKVGASFKGLCPFHQEKSPSFHVIPDKRFFHCFGCQKNGDVFRFVMELEGKSFHETVRELGDRCGVAIPEREESPVERARRDERGRLFEVNALATAYFEETLASPAGDVGRAYLARRGIGDEVARAFRLGMAPEAWDGLARHLEARARGRRDVLEAALALGLVAPRGQGRGLYDRFRGRLMCPVILPAGEVVAFSGRLVGDAAAGPAADAPKYINSPASAIYTKGHTLFGLPLARPAFRTKGRAVLVEGNFDVVAMHQAGFPETVGTLGTALTERQIEALRLLAPTVVLCLDGDRAGRSAALKDLGLLLAAGIETRIATLPDGEDPDSFIRKQGRAAMDERIASAQPAIEYFLHEVWGRSERGSSDRRAAAIREAAPILARIPDRMKLEIIVGEFAAALDVDAAVVARAVREAREVPEAAPRMVSAGPRPGAPATSARDPEPRSSAVGEDGRGAPAGSGRAPGDHGDDDARPDPSTPPPVAELKVVAILCDHPQLLPQAEQENVRSLLTDVRLRDIYSAALAGRPLVDALRDGMVAESGLGRPDGPGGPGSQGRPGRLLRWDEIVVREVMAGSYKSVADPARTLAEAVRSLRRERLEQAADELARQVRDAERRGDRSLARELVMRQLQTRSMADALKRPEDRR